MAWSCIFRPGAICPHNCHQRISSEGICSYGKPIAVGEPIITDSVKQNAIRRYSHYNTENFKTTTQMNPNVVETMIMAEMASVAAEKLFNQNKKEMDVVKRKKTEIECLYSVSNFATKLLKADDLTTIDARVAKLMTKSANKMAELARQIDKECEELITEGGYEKRKAEQAKVNEAKSKIRELMAFLIKENLPNIQLGNITDGEKFIVSFQRESQNT